MGASKRMFNDGREKELNEAEQSSYFRKKKRKSLVELTKSLTNDSESCKTILSFIEDLEPNYMFDEYVLIIPSTPLWNFERVMQKYSNNDTYTMKKTNRLFLEGKLMERRRLEKEH